MPSGLHKLRLGYVDKSMFLGLETTCDMIVCLLADPKCDFGEIEKTMFQEV
jgi:hypothetical protein